tara:strand:+ start:710 stop:1393 length:684 start_codon:yes stop_codon:yes gene_type:complete
MELIIDNREKYLIELLQQNNIIFTLLNLDIGDIQYKDNNELIYIIERKTVDDLGASITDGRYKEQKSRLLANNKNNIYYIIEGDITECKTLSKKAILGSIVNMIFRDNIKIIYSKDIKQTLDIVIQIQKKYNEGKFKKIENTEESYISSIKIKKKDNMNKNMCNIIQLATIPGVSKNISTIILEKYNTLNNLIEEFKKNDENMLKTLNIGKKTIGAVLSKRIYEYLL